MGSRYFLRKWKTLRVAADPMPGGFTILTFEEIQTIEHAAAKTAETL